MTDKPVLPFWARDFLADTMDLSAEEVGIYLRLLLAAWLSSDCSLPNDPARLRRIAGVGVRKWSLVAGVMSRFWTLEPVDKSVDKSVDNFCWRQKRLSKVQQNVAKKCQTLRDNARLGGQATALKYKNRQPANGAADARPNARPDAKPNPSLNSSIPPNQYIYTSTARAHAHARGGEARKGGGGEEYIRCGLTAEACQRIASRSERSLADTCRALLQIEAQCANYDAFYQLIQDVEKDRSVRDVVAVALHRAGEDQLTS